MCIYNAEYVFKHSTKKKNINTEKGGNVKR